MVEALGSWGIRWIGELGDEGLDPDLLLWDMHRNLDLNAMPDGRTVLHFMASYRAVAVSGRVSQRTVSPRPAADLWR